MEHFWIMRGDGIIYYHDGDDLGVSSDLIAGLFSAINIMASQMDESGLDAIEFGSNKISIRKADGVLFILMHDKRLKDKKIGARLGRIEQKFFDLYPPSFLSAWRGNLAEFAGLSQAITALT